MKQESGPILTIVLPSFNEVSAIGNLIVNIQALGFTAASTELIVVDDGSTDATRELLSTLETSNPGLKLIQTRTRLGLGTSIYTGIQEASGRYILVLDSDGMHDPQYFALLLAEVEKGANLVVGSRYAEGGLMLGAIYPHLSKIVNIALQTIVRSRVRDQLCGFFVADSLNLKSVPQSAFSGFGE